MEKVRLLEDLFDKKLVGVLKFFIVHKEREFYLQEVTNATKVPLATVFRLIKKLKELGIIQELRVKKLKLYRCLDNEKVSFLESLLKEGGKIIDEFVEKARNVEGMSEIILYGRESEEKANVLLIGKAIDSHQVKNLCADFKEQHNFIISALTLEREQYDQMVSMGLYSSTKKSLWKK